MKFINSVIKTILEAFSALFGRGQAEHLVDKRRGYRVTTAKDLLIGALNHANEDIDQIKHDVNIHRDRFEYKLNELKDAETLRDDIARQLEDM